MIAALTSRLGVAAYVATGLVVFSLGFALLFVAAQRDAALAERNLARHELAAEMADHSRTLSLLAETRQRVEEAQTAAAEVQAAEMRFTAQRRPVRAAIAAIPERPLTDAETDSYRLVDELAYRMLHGRPAAP